MKSKFKINGSEPEVFKFPGGEIQVRVPFTHTYPLPFSVEADVRDSDGVLTLFLLLDALTQLPGDQTAITVHLIYLPYARQDRVCAPQEASSLEVFSRLCHAAIPVPVQWVLHDPHNEAKARQLFPNAQILQQPTLMSVVPGLLSPLRNQHYHLVSPDEGARTKTESVARRFEIQHPIILGHKHRDPKTGKLSGFSYDGDVEGKDLLIVDDICDGGGTFLGLASELRKGNPNSVSLYITHGIFSQGKQKLEDVFDRVFCFSDWTV